MKSITPELDALTEKEWIQRIKAYAPTPGSLRTGLASIIWWDFFGERQCERELTPLEKISWEFSPVSAASDMDLLGGLIAMGYSPHRAKRRLKLVEDPK